MLTVSRWKNKKNETFSPDFILFEGTRSGQSLLTEAKGLIRYIRDARCPIP